MLSECQLPLARSQDPDWLEGSTVEHTIHK
jgi:hypothetical protein